MKNEIGRKLTSLTIMAIMFAGGMAIGVPSFMPEAQSDFSKTDGMLTVSSEYIQGGAILEVVVNDPAYSVTDDDINDGPEVYIQGIDHIMSQALNGKWYLYIVDDSTATALTADSTGLEYGFQCTTGIGVGKSADIISDDTTGVYDVFANAVPTSGETANSGGGCLNLDGAIGTSETSCVLSGCTTERELMTDAVLQSAPTLSDHNGSADDLGQRGHLLNSSGYGSWPYILAIDFSNDEVIEYGDDSINVEFGNTDDYISLSLTNRSPAANAALHVTVVDPALNIDPTTADKWIFDLDAAAADSSVIFNNNGTESSPNTAMSPAELGDMGCVDNCRLSVDSTTGIAGTEYDAVTMTESGTNTGVFESFDVNGTSEINTADAATGDSKIIFDYNGDTVDMIITYNDATIEFDAGGDWLPANAITVTINDPDMNTNPLDQDLLEVGNPDDIIPTIIMGDPLSITDAGTNSKMTKGSSDSSTGAHFGGGSAEDDDEYDFTIYNTTDTSERLRIVMSGVSGDASDETNTWYNFTTGHTRTQLVNLPGTVVLSYDITGITDITGSSDINVYVSDDGSNITDSDHTSIECFTAGNNQVGVCDLHGEADGGLFPRDVGTTSWGGVDNAGTSFVTVNFEVTHASGSTLSADSDIAVAIDFCNFDQNNGSDTHNCVYRIEAEETGDDTGIFEGTVEYINLNNATSNGTTSGESDGNDFNVDGLLTDVNSTQDVIVVLMDGTDGSDAVRVTYNDTDSIQAGDVIGAQIDTSTHSGTVDLDADTYEADDIATITVVDADLNLDSGVRDTYQNSSTTFQVTVTGSDGTSHYPFATNPMTLIETDVSSGVFAATFTVPDYNGQDIEVTYYESKNAGGNTVELYDIATVESNSGSVAFDKSVYPVPFDSGDLEKGDNSNDLTVDGNVTITVTVSDADFTGETLTTGTTDEAGTIEIILVEGTTTATCYTAGSQVATSSTDTSIDELGPLSEVVRDSSEYEIEFSVDKVQHCGATMNTISSGDIIQVKYADASDDSGSAVSVYDSSTFDLRTGSLSVDKDVYVLGSDMVVTLTDPDLNLDAGSTETYDMDIIEWDSDASSSELMGDTEDFTNNPSSIEETGDDTGVFQTVVTIPTASIKAGDGASAAGTTIDFGEAVTLTYADQGLSGEDNVGDDDLDVETYFSISNFGALIELDQAVYSWTDVVYFSITAPDHNTNSASEDQIGTAALPIQITTRAGKLCSDGDKTYVADESGPDTGVFEGEVQLVGFSHTLSSSSTAFNKTADQTCGSTNDGGIIKTAGQTDGISVSYEYNDAQVVVASASVVWNIGEASFDSSAVSAGGSGVVTVVDQDENTDDDIIDTFTVDVFSDSDAGGFQLTMNETNEDTGVFEGTVYFSSEIATSGSTLRVSEGDTVTAEYVDETLPEPYTSDDDLTIAATTTVGTAFPPLERAPAANARVVDAFGASVAEVSVDQQVQIAADVSNGQSSDQAFAYLVQVQDGDGVTVSLAWITGSLTAGQSMSPALSWTPSSSGSYTATVFVWESVDNPTALSPTVSVDIDVV